MGGIDAQAFKVHIGLSVISRELGVEILQIVTCSLAILGHGRGPFGEVVKRLDALVQSPAKLVIFDDFAAGFLEQNGAFPFTGDEKFMPELRGILPAKRIAEHAVAKATDPVDHHDLWHSGLEVH